MKLVRPLILSALLFAALTPAGASAESFNFFSADGLGPSGGAGNVGPANVYPSSISVAGLTGNLSKVSVTILNFNSAKPDDIDMLLVGPEGNEVMLMSDACGESSPVFDDVVTFEDAAPAPPPDSGPCPTKSVVRFKPSNYVGGAPEPDQFGAGGAVAPPYSTALSTLVGSNPNGSWDLFILDDDESTQGFEIAGWALTLTVDSPLTPTTIVETVVVPGPPAPSRKTGKRAAALAKCAKKKTAKKRAHCRARARKLPV